MVAGAIVCNLDSLDRKSRIRSLKLLGSKKRSTNKTVIIDKLKQRKCTVTYTVFYQTTFIISLLLLSPGTWARALDLFLTAHAAEHTAPPTHDIPHSTANNKTTQRTTLHRHPSRILCCWPDLHRNLPAPLRYAEIRWVGLHSR